MKRSIAGFVLGLIGGIIGIMGGLCDSACAAAESTLTTGSADGGLIPIFFVVGGSILGLVGGCLCFKKAGVGGAMQLIAAAMMVISMIVVGDATTMTVIALILMAVAGLCASLSKRV